MRLLHPIPRRLCRPRLLPRARPAPHLFSTTTPVLARKRSIPATTARKKTETLNLSDLALYPSGLEQGLLSPTAVELAELPPIIDSPLKRYPPVINQALDNITSYPDCVLLTRVGGFYELYFTHAEQYAARLGIKLAYKKTAAGQVAMAGFPFWNLSKYLKILVLEEGKNVAIAEEVQPESQGKILRLMEKEEEVDRTVIREISKADPGPMWDRKVARIVTPGTLIDEEWVEGGENNFLLAVEVPVVGSEGAESERGLAWADLGTGEVWCAVCKDAELRGEVGRISPRELVVRKGVAEVEMLKEGGAGWVVSEHGMSMEGKMKEYLEMWRRAAVNTEEVEADRLKKLKKLELTAAARLLNYVEKMLPGIPVKLQAPVPRMTSRIMKIDGNSMRGLEIKTTMRDGAYKGSLMHTVDRTVTRGGKRLLSNWLTNPSIHLPTIEARQEQVAAFLADEELREDMVELLNRTYDSQRIVQKFSLNRGSPDDLVALARTIEATQDIVNRLKKANNPAFADLIERLDVPMDLAKRILNSIDEDGLQRHQHEAADVASSMGEDQGEEIYETLEESDGFIGGVVEDQVDDDNWIMKSTASPLLQAAHAQLKAYWEAKDHLEVHLRNKLNAQTLTLKWSPNLGHYCYVKGKDFNIGGVTAVSSSRTTKSFLHPEWTNLGEKIIVTRLRIRTEEKVVQQQILLIVLKHITQLRSNALVLDELDVTSSFALLAREMNLTRPKLTKSPKHKIIGARHITVEAGLREDGKTFTANDCFVGDGKASLWLITGPSNLPRDTNSPNMAGKSTYLRSIALLSLLAQTGSFIPATFSEMGLIDRLFSRIGSSDNLYRSQSTFMVEMLETAHILKSATSKSFVIMDEIGRGTTPRDGAAVAYATLMELVERGCRTLFASHFHELGDWTEGDRRVKRWCTDVEEDEGGWRFQHKLREGVNKESHALKVARMAGVPEEVVERARKVLEERKELEVVGESVLKGSEE
ncbi:Similar to MutS protein homolog 1; acc. no. O13921 [Pyronema omphalodes CBS 100304]|uniref:Similar to MutS protein homolog 1 acc. no. O13921 n=1 Tax=Pyronema omphalodes (strain CBS 100304) TaxID=1076935 RepID=U4LAI1_PYROM|nr:Similar to MutS protein homolog 1; acc. no. O13921 [Pyronema omphalodes CBS 100304]